MGTFQSFRKAYGALKDSTKVGLAKVNSEFKELDIAIVKATNHVECPPKERHVRKIFSATSVIRPRADVAYCIHALAKRLSKTKNWIVILGLLCMGSNLCSLLEERLECFRILKYDIESERLTKSSPGATKVHSRTRLLGSDELLEQLPALQQLLYRLIGCQPEGAAYHNYIIQYALALFFDMSRHDAVKALNIYKRAGQQAENLADFYEYCKGLDLARNFQFPTLRQPPPSFLATMEEYIKEAPQAGSVGKRLEYHETELPPQKPEEPAESEKQEEKVEENEPMEETQDEPEPKEEEVVEAPQPLISTEDTGDLLGLNEVIPLAAELEQNNALALAIVQPGNDPLSSNRGLNEISGSGWELALVTTPSNITRPTVESKFGGGFDKLLLDSLYEDDNARRQIQMQNAGYGYGGMAVQNPFEQNDPFATSSNIAPPTNVQMAMMAQHQQQQQFMMQQSNQQQNMMVPYQFPAQQSQFPQPQFPPQQQMQQMDYSNPFGDPFHAMSKSSTTQQGNHMLL
ncbi:hypothetical protein LWI28_006717 [Acer negundo]|uniref:ENTH domain-containing protein n=1 Tax=Acer negundo TaxID=4023 RepID=A0AAD5J8E2_ACENE|nr:hypothetical protein LWI28_006717 [Acer negundo]